MLDNILIRLGFLNTILRLMIVLSHQKGWKIISQRSHGLLAAMLAYQYDIDLPNEIIVPALIAIAEHDDGIQETTQATNLTEAGAPRHFMVNDNSKKGNLIQQLNVIEISSAKSQLNALLTSLHLKFLYGGQKDHSEEKEKEKEKQKDNGNLKDKQKDNRNFKEKDKKDEHDKELEAFLKDQEKMRAEALKNLGIDKKYADRLYHFLEWCDAFSLLICMDKIQLQGRKMEVSQSPDGDMSQTFYKKNNEITVEPWAFKNDTFKVFYEYKILEQLKFNSIEEFNQVCKDAPVQRQEFIFSK